MDIGEPDSDPAKEIAEQIKALMADKALVVGAAIHQSDRPHSPQRGPTE